MLINFSTRNEPAIFNDETFKTFTLAVQHNMSLRNGKQLQIPHRFVHNGYGHSMARASLEGIKHLQPNSRPFLLTRSGYAGRFKLVHVWYSHTIQYERCPMIYLNYNIKVCKNMHGLGVVITIVLLLT